MERRVEEICNGTALARDRGAPLRHVLIYGKPGTGKSETAKAIGNSISGLPYAVMSGSDLAPLGKHGPAELRKILTWAKSSKRGAMLIIDEAEAALGSRLRNSGGDASNEADNDSFGSYARDSLNVLLSLTGSASCDLMLVLTTSNPQGLDEAILDRMDELVELQLPGTGDRLRILNNSFQKRFISPQNSREANGRFSSRWLSTTRTSRRVRTEASFDVELNIKKLCGDAMTRGCSGRELDKLLQSVVTNVYGDVHGNGILTQGLWESVTRSYCNDLRQKWRLLKYHEGPTRRDDVPELSLE